MIDGQTIFEFMGVKPNVFFYKSVPGPAPKVDAESIEGSESSRNVEDKKGIKETE